MATKIRASMLSRFINRRLPQFLEFTHYGPLAGYYLSSQFTLAHKGEPVARLRLLPPSAFSTRQLRRAGHRRHATWRARALMQARIPMTANTIDGVNVSAPMTIGRAGRFITVHAARRYAARRISRHFSRATFRPSRFFHFTRRKSARAMKRAWLIPAGKCARLPPKMSAGDRPQLSARADFRLLVMGASRLL